MRGLTRVVGSASLEADASALEPVRARPRRQWLVSARGRLVISLALGLLAGGFTTFSLGRPGFDGDIEFPWRGAQLLLAGVNPYGITEYQGETLYGGAPLFYPLPTLWLMIPVAWLPSHLAGGIIFGIATAALAYALTADAPWRVHVFLSGSFWIAASLGQWAPLLMLAALVPLAGPLWILKPSLGLAALAYRSSRWALGVGVSVLLLSAATFPSWPLLWLQGVAGSPQHVAPVLLLWGGPLLLLAALRWRAPGGRLLLVLSCVPQFLFFYDQVLFWLLPRTRRESLWLTIANVVGVLAWIGASTWVDQPYQQIARPMVLLSCYLPALVLVLRHPNRPWPESAPVSEASRSGRVGYGSLSETISQSPGPTARTTQV